MAAGDAVQGQRGGDAGGTRQEAGRGLFTPARPQATAPGLPQRPGDSRQTRDKYL